MANTMCQRCGVTEDCKQLEVKLPYENPVNGVWWLCSQCMEDAEFTLTTWFGL